MFNQIAESRIMPAGARSSAGRGLRQRLTDWLRYQRAYHQAMDELQRLDDRDLDDINIARADFPLLADRHARQQVQAG